MFTNYRTLFDIKSDKDDLVGQPLMRDAEEVLRAWAYRYFQGIEDIPDRENILKDPEGATNGRKWVGGGNLLRFGGENFGGYGYFRLRWYGDYKGENDYQHYLGFRLATEGPAVQADLVVQVENRESGYFNEQVRRVMDDLLSKYQCSTLGVILSKSAEQVQMEQVEAFWERLSSPERCLPIVMVSENRSGIVPVDADALQWDLLGLAEVVRCPAEVAWKLGWYSRKLMCHDGQVRVYAPRLSVDDDEWDHRVWGFENVDKLGYYRFLQLLRDECERRIYYPNRDALRVFSHVRRRVSALMLEGIRENSSQETQEALELAESVQDDYNEVRDDKNELQDANDKLREEVHTLKSTVQSLQAHLSAQQSLSSGGYDAPVPGGNEDPRSRVRSVADVVEEVIKNWRYVRVFEKVVKDCAQMPKSDAQKFYDVLKKLNDCGEDRSAGTLGMSEADWMRNRISNFTGGESEPTMNQYGEERRFRDDDGTIVEMQQHIRIGKLRVHLCWSDEKSRWLVGYFGEHLTISSTG